MNSTDKFADFDEFELDLTGEIEAPATSEQRTAGRQQTSSSLAGTVDCRNQRHSVRIDDLSINGVGVTLDSRLPLNEECQLTIQLVVCGMDYELAMKCRVRHCEAVNSRSYHCGLQFIDMTQGTRDTLLLLTGG
jgi:c-di-GMP-binding flagellar brake protein YcgR